MKAKLVYLASVVAEVEVHLLTCRASVEREVGGDHPCLYKENKLEKQKESSSNEEIFSQVRPKWFRFSS